MKKLISLVIPVYNEEQNLDELYRRLKEVMAKEPKYNFEVIAVEHGSKDTSFAKL